MKLALTGDVMLGRLVDQHIIRNRDIEPEHVWGETLQLLRNADFRLINLECVIANSGRPWREWKKAFHFRAHPRAVKTLKVAGVDFVSLANNHSLDYGAEALAECIELLEKAAIIHAGAGKGKVEAQRPATLEKNGKSVAIVSLTDKDPEWETTAEDWGVFYVDYDENGLREPYRFHVQQSVETARGSGDILIVCAHVGANWGPPTAAMRALAHELIDMGADCYWGHSNHTPQAVEIYRGKPILYSTGDFIDDYAVDPVERNDLSFLFVLEWEGNGWKLTMYPTKITGFRVNRAYGKDAVYVMNRMENISRAFGADVIREEDILIMTG